MKETYEFRIPEGWALEWLEPDDGKTTSTKSVRIVTALRDSELFDRILSIQRERMRVGERFFLSWRVRREYEKAELDAAELFVVTTSNLFEPTGEEMGCHYLPDVDGPAEADNRVGSLVLKCSRFRGTSFCESIAGERLAAPELQALVHKERFSGVRFGPVFCKGAENSQARWAELIITSHKISITSPTLTGNGLLDAVTLAVDEHHPNIGLNVLSEVFIQRTSWDGSDFAVSKQTVGVHQGLLRPSRVLFVSQRLFLSLSPRMKRGLCFEIARFS